MNCTSGSSDERYRKENTTQVQFYSQEIQRPKGKKKKLIWKTNTRSWEPLYIYIIPKERHLDSRILILTFTFVLHCSLNYFPKSYRQISSSTEILVFFLTYKPVREHHDLKQWKFQLSFTKSKQWTNMGLQMCGQSLLQDC